MRRVLIALLVVLWAVPAWAGAYWVSPTGAAANWAACQSATALSGAAACTLAQANANAADGDTVYLRGGSYTYEDANHIALNPVNSGSSSSSRITFAAHTGETPVLDSSWTSTPYTYGISLTVNYIVIDGITVHNKHAGIQIVGGHYNEIRNCIIYADGTNPDSWTGAINPFFLNTGASHNWVHHNTIHTFGLSDGEGSDGIIVGHSGDNSPNHNTFSNNTIYHLGHSIADDYGTANVWLNNVVHNEGWKTDGFTLQIIYGTATGGASGVLRDSGTNFVTAGVVAGMLLHTTGIPTSEPMAVGVVDSVTTTTNTNDTVNFHMYSYWLPAFTAGTGYAFTPATVNNAPDVPGRLPGNGKYGHRNFSLSNDSGTDTAKYVLLEGNRIGYASINYNNRGAEGISLGSPGNIIRYNAIFGSDASGIGIKSYTGADHYGDNNRIYNNTFYKNGQAQVSAPNDYLCVAVSDIYEYANFYKNNLLFANGTAACDVYGDWSTATGTFANNLCAVTDAATGCTATTNPGFANTTMTDPTSATLPDLSLTAGADAIEKGGALTTVHADDTGSGTTLRVTDALYFQDGTLGSSLAAAAGVVKPDWIAIGTVGNAVAISSIDYATNTITLASGVSRSDGDSVWLYKRADGTPVLLGSAPDAGAYEYASVPNAPTNVRIR